MSTRQSVLLIENDPWVCSFVTEKLQGLGCDVVVANSAETAKELGPNQEFDLILRDLPKPFSLELLEWRLKNSRVDWHKTPNTLAASA